MLDNIVNQARYHQTDSSRSSPEKFPYQPFQFSLFPDE